MTTIIGLALTLVNAGTSLTTALPSVTLLILARLVILAVELVIGGAAIHQLRKVNRKATALMRRRQSLTREEYSPQRAENALGTCRQFPSTSPCRFIALPPSMQSLTSNDEVSRMRVGYQPEPERFSPCATATDGATRATRMPTP